MRYVFCMRRTPSLVFRQISNEVILMASFRVYFFYAVYVILSLETRLLISQKCIPINKWLDSVVCSNISAFTDIKDEIKTHWRELIVRNHPDSLFYSGEWQSNLINLEILDLSEAGKVQIRNFHRFPSLKRLDISGCDIEDLPFDYFGTDNQLEIINASNNRLSHLTPQFRERLTKVKYADFSENEISTLDGGDCDKLPLLEHLNLNSNKFKELNIGWCMNLKYLSLDDNLVQTIFNDSLNVLPKLEYLSIAANSLTNISAGAFASHMNLRTLNLSSNQLEYLNQAMFFGNTQERMQIVDLHNNKLRNLLPDQFKYISQLQGIDLSKNKLQDIHADAFRNLQQLIWIDLHMNNLEEIHATTFQNLNALSEIDLSYNKIKHIFANSFENLPQLNTLKLRNNDIEMLPTFQGIKSLRFLDLSRNILNALNNSEFSKLNDLRILHLEYNKLTIISADVLETLNSLRELYIKHNRLIFLPYVDATFPKLKNVTIEGNPWQCACFKFLIEWFHFKNITFIDFDSPFFKGEKPVCFMTKHGECMQALNTFSEETLERYLHLLS